MKVVVCALMKPAASKVQLPACFNIASLQQQFNRRLSHNAQGNTATDIHIQEFHEAITHGDVHKTQQFLSAHGLANARNSQGWTPLMVAAKNGNAKLIELLLNYRGSTSTLSPSGHTATELAAFWNHKSCFELLKSATTGDTEVPKHFFSDNPLEPADSLRRQPGELYRLAQQRASKFVVFVEGKPLVMPANSKASKFVLFTRSLPQVQGVMNNDVLDSCIFLGCHKGEVVIGSDILDDVEASYQLGGGWFAVEVSKTQAALLTSADSQAQPISGFPGNMLRLLPSDAAICGKAASLIAWHNASKHCTLCGSETSLSQAGYKRKCHNASCKSNKSVVNASHPRVDPSIITLVLSEDETRCLLGRQKRFLPNMYSCLAGFVEPGESMEAACSREVHEEVGLRLSRMTYHSSQPWPMPNVLMLAFTAHTPYQQPTIDKEELEDARWFSREESASLLTLSHPEGLFTPPPQAIAHQLIKTWLLRTAFQTC